MSKFPSDALVRKRSRPYPPVTMVKGSFPQSSFILRVHYLMASSRILAEDLIEAVFDDDFELDDDEDSGCDDDNNI